MMDDYAEANGSISIKLTYLQQLYNSDKLMFKLLIKIDYPSHDESTFPAGRHQRRRLSVKMNANIFNSERLLLQQLN